MRKQLHGLNQTDDSFRPDGANPNGVLSLLDLSPDLLFTLNDQAAFTYANAGAEKILDRQPNELLGTSFFQLLPEGDRSTARKMIQQARQEKTAACFKSFCFKKDGCPVFMQWQIRSNQNGILEGIGKDLSEKLAEDKKLGHLQSRLKNIHRISQLGWWEADCRNNRLYASEELFEVYGLPPGKESFIASEQFLSMVHPEDQARVEQDLALLYKRTLHQFEHRLIRPSGEVIHLLHYVQAMKDEAGNIIAFQGATKDITARKKAQQFLEESQNKLQTYSERLTAILENLGDGFIALDHQFTVTYWNRKAEELLGIGRDKILETCLWDHFPEAVQLKFFSEYTKAIATGEPVHFEEYLPAKKMWLEVSAYPSCGQLSVYFKNINERRKQLQEIKTSNERFEFVSKATGDTIWDWDAEKGLTFYNEEVTGSAEGKASLPISFEEKSGRIYEMDKEKVKQSLQNALNDPQTRKWQQEYRICKQDGGLGFVQDKAIIIRNEAGKAVRMVGSMQDITRLKVTEKILERSEKRFKTLVQSGKDMILLMDHRFHISFISENAQKITGFLPGELEGKQAALAIHPKDRRKVMAAVSRIFCQKEVQLPLFRIKTKSGKYRWLETTLTNHIKDADISAIVANTQDVTHKKRVQDKVRMLSHVVENTSNSVIIANAKGQITWVNQAFVNRTGYCLEEAIGKGPQELLHGKDTCAKTQAYILERVNGRLPFECEIINYTKSGEKQWAEVKGHPVFDGEGNFQQYFTIQTDITKRKEYEEALQVSEERYRLLFTKSPVPKWICHAETFRFVEVNEAAIRLYGYSREEFFKMIIPDIKPEGEKSSFYKLLPIIKKKGFFNGHMLHQKKSGEIIQVEITIHCIELPAGPHFMVTTNDLTEKISLQNLLIEEKLLAQKEIARTIIATQEQERTEIGKELHDNVNQILTTAKLYMENTLYFPEKREAFTKSGIELVQNAIHEIRLLSRMLATPAHYEMNICTTLSDLLDQYITLKTFRIEKEFSFQEDDLGKELKLTIYRIVQEQLNNIVKYAQATKVLVAIRASGSTITLHIEDNGRGFDPNQKKKGLGHANIISRAEIFKGATTILSEPGKGCCLTILFPLAG